MSQAALVKNSRDVHKFVKHTRNISFLKTLMWQWSCVHVHTCSTMHLSISWSEATFRCGRSTLYPFLGQNHYRISVDREHFIRFKFIRISVDRPYAPQGEADR